MSTAPKGMKAARQNKPQYYETGHPWHIPYNSRCLLKDCQMPVYHDGKIYFSLCLKHLQELELGPFYKSKHKGLETDDINPVY